MNHDLYVEILTQLPYVDIMNMCSTTSDYNQVCQSRDLWQKLMLRDYKLDLIDEWTISEMKELYKKLYHLVDQTIIKIMCKLMPRRKTHNNLQLIYDELFYMLSYYYNDAHEFNSQNFKNYTKKLVTKIFTLFGKNYLDNDPDNLNNITYNIVDKFYYKFENFL